MASKLWTWVGGSNQTDQPGFYGTKGEPSLKSIPGARRAHTMAMDPFDQIIYVFGGFGNDAAQNYGNTGGMKLMRY